MHRRLSQQGEGYMSELLQVRVQALTVAAPGACGPLLVSLKSSVNKILGYVLTTPYITETEKYIMTTKF